jgi:hypothetical protein
MSINMSIKGLEEHLEHHRKTDLDQAGGLYWGRMPSSRRLEASLLTHYIWHKYPGLDYNPDHIHIGIEIEIKKI